MKRAGIEINYELYGTQYEAIARRLVEKFKAEKGKRGLPARRELAQATLNRLAEAQMPRIRLKKFQQEVNWGASEQLSWPFHRTPESWARHVAKRVARGKQRAALALATKAGQNYDEHGSGRGDYLRTEGLDFVPPTESADTPYFDMGGAGLATIRIMRKRVYASSSKWYPTETSTTYLIGRNEIGTYFAHPVGTGVNTVREAVDWIWEGRTERIIMRQGDIALIESRGPARMPAWLPGGHSKQGSKIVHATHPAIPVPQHGEAIIVGRRAVTRASNGTRD